MNFCERKEIFLKLFMMRKSILVIVGMILCQCYVFGLSSLEELDILNPEANHRMALLIGIQRNNDYVSNEPIPRRSIYDCILFEKDVFKIKNKLVVVKETEHYGYANYLYTETSKDSDYYSAFIEIVKPFEDNKDLVEEVIVDVDLPDQVYAYFASTDQVLYMNDTYVMVYHEEIYTTGAGGYQMLPSVRLHPHDDFNRPVSLIDMYSETKKNELTELLESLKLEYNHDVHVESNDDKQYISEKDMFLKRKEGQWQLMVPVVFENWKGSHVYFVDEIALNFDLPLSLKEVLNDQWKNIQLFEPNMIDYRISPDGKEVLIQVHDRIKVFEYDGQNIGQQKYDVPLKADDKIVYCEWLKQSDVRHDYFY